MTTPEDTTPFWDDAEVAVLRAVMDRIIPPDQDPGAIDAGVDLYILAQLQGDAAALAEALRHGLAGLEDEALRRHGRSLAVLAADRRDDMLREGEGLAWFRALAELTAEGFYADPGNGNRDACSWRMIGYEHRLPEGPSGPPARDEA